MVKVAIGLEQQQLQQMNTNYKSSTDVLVAISGIGTRMDALERRMEAGGAMEMQGKFEEIMAQIQNVAAKVQGAGQVDKDWVL